MRSKVCAHGQGHRFPGHHELAPMQRARVTLDGREVRGFAAVDVATGVGIRAKRDSEGNIVVDRQRSEIVEERITGRFRILEVMDGCH